MADRYGSTQIWVVGTVNGEAYLGGTLQQRIRLLWSRHALTQMPFSKI